MIILYAFTGVLVALRKESVDRNLAVWAVEHAYQVALRKESVDRNVVMLLLLTSLTRSLSARRAWIEMRVRGYSQFLY